MKLFSVLILAALCGCASSNWNGDSVRLNTAWITVGESHRLIINNPCLSGYWVTTTATRGEKTVAQKFLVNGQTVFKVGEFLPGDVVTVEALDFRERMIVGQGIEPEPLFDGLPPENR